MPAQDLKRLLQKSGVSAEEMSWVHLDEYLENNPIVFKSDLINRIQSKLHNIVVHEMDYEQEHEDNRDTTWGTQFDDEDYFKGYEDYTLPYGDDYKEFLITIGAKPEDEFIDYLMKINTGYERMGREALKKSIEEHPGSWRNHWGHWKRSLGEDFPDYESRHFEGHKNPIAHMRTTSRTSKDGKKSLHIEEIQSDWHQDGRKHGYDRPGRAKDIITVSKLWEKVAVFKSATEEEKKEYEAAKTRLERDQWRPDTVPPGPYAKNWHELAMKHAIDMAVRGGYDRVTWNTGDISRNIFGLSNVLDKLELTKDQNGRIYIRGWMSDKIKVNQQAVESKELANYIGKDLAEKFLSSGQESMVIQGKDLEYGGYGLQAFYDHILPSFTKKYIKKWNGDVGEHEVNQGQYMHYIQERPAPDGSWIVRQFSPSGLNESTESFPSLEEAKKFKEENRVKSWAKVHGFDITPEMREDIQNNGQRLATSIVARRVKG